MKAVSANFSSDIFVMTKTPLIFYLVFVACPNFRFSFSLVDENSKQFRHFRHRVRCRRRKKHCPGPQIGPKLAYGQQGRGHIR